MKILQPVLKTAPVKRIKKYSGWSSEVHISLLVDSFVCSKVDRNLIYLSKRKSLLGSEKTGNNALSINEISFHIARATQFFFFFFFFFGKMTKVFLSSAKTNVLRLYSFTEPFIFHLFLPFNENLHNSNCYDTLAQTGF